MFLRWFLVIFNAQLQSEGDFEFTLVMQQIKNGRHGCLLHANLSCNLRATTVWEMFKTIHYWHSQWANLIKAHSYDVLHQMSCELLGHYLIRNVTQFHSCRSDNKFCIGKQQSQRHFDKNTILKSQLTQKLPIAFHSSNICSIEPI